MRRVEVCVDGLTNLDVLLSMVRSVTKLPSGLSAPVPCCTNDLSIYKSPNDGSTYVVFY